MPESPLWRTQWAMAFTSTEHASICTSWGAAKTVATWIVSHERDPGIHSREDDRVGELQRIA
ncbi:hypothetical protein OV079_05800 [Nannocystis pusilla]|uniref:Uncharacterized protein n=1 Tax=Nannocystis pusilla TaxID=889268 RepID=A0A9X3EJ98_9BACT|nr:hypothetical protein [Nannocystis pusilla]MCY1005092.1 hypothetical protein [Nannocystis pusilla]